MITYLFIYLLVTILHSGVSRIRKCYVCVCVCAMCPFWLWLLMMPNNKVCARSEPMNIIFNVIFRLLEKQTARFLQLLFVVVVNDLFIQQSVLW